jgi:hypothetical protein
MGGIGQHQLWHGGNSRHNTLQRFSLEIDVSKVRLDLDDAREKIEVAN